MHEVETETIRRHQRACLPDVRPQHVAQRRMQEVCRRVIAPRGIAQRLVDEGFD